MVTTKPKLVTPDELLAMGSDARFELIDGELIEMSPAGPDHRVYVSRINMALILYQASHNTIRAWVGDSGVVFARQPDTVLVPDISVETVGQVSGQRLGRHGMVETIPTIAIEVKSPMDRESQIERKLGIYLAAGVQEVWWVRPDKRAVSIYRLGRDPRVITGTDGIESPDILPGFSFGLDMLFAPDLA